MYKIAYNKNFNIEEIMDINLFGYKIYPIQFINRFGGHVDDYYVASPNPAKGRLAMSRYGQIKLYDDYGNGKCIAEKGILLLGNKEYIEGFSSIESLKKWVIQSIG